MLRSGPEKLNKFTVQKDSGRFRLFINGFPGPSSLVGYPYFEALIMGATLFQLEEIKENPDANLSYLSYCHHLLKEYQVASKEEYAEYQQWLKSSK